MVRQCDWCKGKKTLDIEFVDKTGNPHKGKTNCPRCFGAGTTDEEAENAAIEGLIDKFKALVGDDFPTKE